MKASLFLLIFFGIITSLPAQVTDKIPGIDCNNIVDDKLKGTGATNRSASACEIEFDRRVRIDLQNAFGKLIREWATRDWIIEDTLIQTLTQRSRSSEKQFYFLEYILKLNLKANNPLYQSLQKKFADAMEELRSHPSEAATRNFYEAGYKARGITQITIRVLINNPTSRIGFFKGGYQPLKIEGASYGIKGAYMVPETGGQIEDGKDGCFLLFGQPKVTTEKNTDGAVYITSQNIFPKASHLTVQQITQRIECSDEWQSEVLKQVDSKALAKMIGSW